MEYHKYQDYIAIKNFKNIKKLDKIKFKRLKAGSGFDFLECESFYLIPKHEFWIPSSKKHYLLHDLDKDFKKYFISKYDFYKNICKKLLNDRK